MPFGGLLTVGLITAGGALAGSAISAHASGKAADQQAEATQKGIDEQKREFDKAQENAAPFVGAGQTSIADLMAALKSGKFGIGSSGAAPQFMGSMADFKAPTLAEAQATPGYEFTRQQGTKGILQASAAAGGAISGGTIRAADSYNTNLANSTYGDVFNRNLSTYQTNLNKSFSDYQAKLAGYGADLAGNQQEFGQLLAPAQIGSGSTANLNATGATSAASIAGLMQSLGTSQAAGTVGAANAINSGIGGATSGITQAIQLQQLLKSMPAAG